VRSLASWSTRRVVVACVLWLVGAPVLAALGLVLGGLVVAGISGDQRVGFTARLSDWTLAWFYVPPLVLIGAWLWLTRGASAKERSDGSDGEIETL
jgi:hypothetical protein